VIAEDADLRVYRPKRAAGSSEVPVVACRLKTGTRMTLISARRPPGVHPWHGPGSLRTIVTAGDVVERLTGVDTSSTELVVADVAHRQVLREARVGYGVDAGLVFDESVADLVATPLGAVAWIAQRSGGAARSLHYAAFVVYTAPPRGHVAKLDEGDTIEPESLYLSGDTVHWVDGGVTRSAPLP
jgi:hypothetical protein